MRAAHGQIRARFINKHEPLRVYLRDPLPERFTFGLDVGAVLFFGGLGLLLAVAGVYALISYAVALRTREMGIRLALGTTPARLRRALLGHTFIVIGAGAVVGTALAIACGGYLRSLITGADAALIDISIQAVGLTALIAAIAIWSATRRIARLDIADVLRAEAAD